MNRAREMIYNSYQASEQPSDMIELEDFDFEECHKYVQENAATTSLTSLVNKFIHDKYKCCYHYADYRVEIICDIIRKIDHCD